MEKQLKVLKINWSIKECSPKEEKRYCHNCGKKVIFRDSLIRRENANGKNISRYAIYKCPEDHTWNKKLADFKSRPDMENTSQVLEKFENCIESINLQEIFERGYEKVEILVICLGTRTRLDKLLSNNIDDLTRNKIQRAIKDGVITLKGQGTEGKVIIKSETIIGIDLRSIVNDQYEF